MMKSPIVRFEKIVQTNEDSLECSSKDIKSAEDDSWSERLVRKVKPEHSLLLDSRIPNQVISLDESYLHRCLELLDISALKVASCTTPSPDPGVFLDRSRSEKTTNGNLYDLNGVVLQCPSTEGTENVVIRSSGNSILDATTRSKSIMNILKGPLLRQSDDSNLVQLPEYMNLHKDIVVNENRRNGSVSVRKSVGSLSSTNSTCSDQSSCSHLASICQGMLHCTWNNGLPHYVFSVDDQKEIYIANLLKVESPNNKMLDYLYTFYSATGRRKEDDVYVKEADLVGKMRVSTSFAVLSDNSEITETQFVLFGFSDDCLNEMQNTSHILTKNKGFSRKVMEVVKSSQTYKLRSSTKLGISSAIQENSSWDSYQDAPTNLTEDYLVPNLELAAIIVKDHIRDAGIKTDTGGWGLKFLKKAGNIRTNGSVETEIRSECCVRNDGECSTSMEILIPAGFHGGPRTRNSGPSSLTERWRSNGRCDCGGWDIGCPITILNTKLSRADVLPETEIRQESKTLELFVQGSNQESPTMRMVNINDGLYYIPFQSNLSAIQSLAIAAAIIHSRSPTLQPKLYEAK